MGEPALNNQFISKVPGLSQSQDYAFLRDHGLAHIEKLARTLWTDYNVHDPGITILEHLCYALTDLGYRTSYDIQDLLTETEQGQPINRSNFHQAREIFTCYPVSFDDLRKVLIDIQGVKNAWIEPHRSVTYYLNTKDQELADVQGPMKFVSANPPLNGLYDVFIEYDESVEPLHAGLLDETTSPEGFIHPGGRGLRFHVAHELVLEAVSVYPDSQGFLQVRLLDEADNERFSQVVDIKQGNQKLRIPLGWRIPPGENYRLEALAAKSSAVKLHRRSDSEFPYGIDHLVSIVSGVKGAEVQRPYFFFYDWEIFSVMPHRAFVQPASHEVFGGLDDREGDGSFIEPQNKGLNFEVFRDLTLESVTVYPETVGTLRIRLIDAVTEQELGVREQVMSSAVESADITLGFTLKPGMTYRLDAVGSTTKLFRNTSPSFPMVKEHIFHIIQGVPSESTYYFFYHWRVTYPAFPQPVRLSPGEVHWAVKDGLHTHRNLCEDFVNVCDLDTEEIALCTDLDLEPSADVEGVVAEVFFQLEQAISPSIRFYNLEEMLAKHKTTDQIFEGPRLRHGFIDDDEFQAIQRKCEIRASDIYQIIMDVPGVRTVKNLSLLSFVDGQFRTQESWILRLATDRFRSPTFSVDRSKIILYKHDLPYYANRTRVDELLTEQRAANIPSKLHGQEQELNLPIPIGEDKQLEAYYPIQNEMPANYRVGRLRVADSETSLRKAQSRQLKAYLLLFEQLLANYLSQLANVRKLFSWDQGVAHTYFTQPLQGVMDLESLYSEEGLAEVIRTLNPLHPGLPEHAVMGTDEERREHLMETLLPAGLNAIIEDVEVAESRKERFLDHLLARFCESFTDYSLLMGNIVKNQSLARVIEDKRLFLEHYPMVSSRRGVAYDYRAPEEEKNLSGFQHRLYRLLGFRGLTRQDLAFSQLCMEEVPQEESEDSETESSESRPWRFVLKDQEGGNIFESIACRSKEAIEMLLDFSLHIGGDPANYEWNEEAQVFQLMRRCPDSTQDEPIGQTTSQDEAIKEKVRGYFDTYGTIEGFHIIEHVLLRKRTPSDSFMPVQLSQPDQCDCVEVRDPYSFRMTILLPSWPTRFRDLKFRQFVEQTLRAEVPAHIYPKICWISHEHMKQFEECYGNWARQLAALEPRLGQCRSTSFLETEWPLSGETPLPEATSYENYPAYRDALDALINKLHQLVTVFPLAQLHDCAEASGEAPQVSLNNTNLGTL